MLRGARLLSLAALLPAPSAAQEDDRPASAIDDKSAKALEKAVPEQPWYPGGYRDIRIAAEAESSETARDRGAIVRACGNAQCYDIATPEQQRIAEGESDAALLRYGNVALDVSRIRQELALVGYPLDVYAAPLADYERQRIEAAMVAPQAGVEYATLVTLSSAIEKRRARLAAGLPRVILFGGDPTTASDGPLVVRASGPSASQFPAGRRLNSATKLTLRAGDRVVLLDNRGTRTLTGPGVFAVSGPPAPAMAQTATPRRTGAVRSIGSGGRGPASSSRPSVIVATSPTGGEVLLVSAFAFKLCSLKQRDAWDRFKCRWNEIETGVPKPLSGRFVYQVRWPDGTVRKGTREIAPAEDAAVTFKKVGS
jgi:hypothetical protein